MGLLRLGGALGSMAIDFVAKHGVWHVKLTDRKRSKVLAEFIDGSNHSWPMIVETSYGRGRFIYLAANMGNQNVEWEMRVGSTYTVREDPQLNEVVLTLVDYAHEAAAPAVAELPSGVVGVIYQLQGGSEAGTIYAQLLNVAGKDVAYGHISPDGIREAIRLPVIEGDMAIRVKAKVRGSGLVHSPEREDVLEIKGRDCGGGYTEFVIPGSALHGYLQLKVFAELVPGQRPCPAPLADEVGGQ